LALWDRGSYLVCCGGAPVVAGQNTVTICDAEFFLRHIFNGIVASVMAISRAMVRGGEQRRSVFKEGETYVAYVPALDVRRNSCRWAASQ
jgi:hypothetical protein